MSIRFDILSLFPDYFASPFSQSIVASALERSLVEIGLVDIRDFSEDKHRRVDDRPYGGGPGMVLQPGPVSRAIKSVRRPASRVIYFSPQGRPLTAQRCRELAEEEHVVLLCGHYEGIDQRVLDAEIDEEISIGDYVLTNGCIPAIALVDAVIRFCPGVLGDADSAERDCFEGDLLGYPQYTRPEVFDGVSVPSPLLSGNHKVIETMRHQQRLEKTRRIRPDLLGA